MGTGKEAIGGAGATKPARALTTRTLESLKPESQPYRIPDTRCKGLAVRVACSGKISFDLAFRIKGGRSRRLSLGGFPDCSLDQARDRANELTKAARAGKDLIEDEKAAQARNVGRLTVKGLIDRYSSRSAAGQLKTASDIERRLRRALAPLLDRAAEDIRRRDVRELFDKVESEGHSREAEKRRQVVGAMFKWAVAKDHVEVNPTTGLPAYEGGAPRERVLLHDEIRTAWSYFEDRSAMPEPHATVLQLELLIGARCGEIGGMHVGELDTEAWVWALPAHRSKNKRARLTPIEGLARDMIAKRLAPGAGYLFLSETGTPLTSTLVASSLHNHRKKIALPHFTSHDLRRTVATLMDEDLGILEETIASVIGHETVGTKATKTLRRHYLHGEKIEPKRIALKAWDQHLRSILFGAAADAGNVVPVASAKRRG